MNKITKNTKAKSIIVKKINKRFITLFNHSHSERIIVDKYTKNMIPRKHYFCLCNEILIENEFGKRIEYEILCELTEEYYYEYSKRIKLIKSFLHLYRYHKLMKDKRLKNYLNKLKQMCLYDIKYYEFYKYFEFDIISYRYNKYVGKNLFYVNRYYKIFYVSKQDQQKTLSILKRKNYQLTTSLAYQVKSLNNFTISLWNRCRKNSILKRINDYKYEISKYSIYHYKSFWVLKDMTILKILRSFKVREKAILYLYFNDNEIFLF